jgi:phosphopantothenoylcysteine decarboxylase/phosphopantothenate--cysteine ligase
MDLEMYRHPSFKENLTRLESHGVQVIPAASGELASGLHGEGRMAEPEDILTALKKKAHLKVGSRLAENASS